MPEVKEVMPEENSHVSALIEIQDNTSEVQAILNASYELYATIRDGDANLTPGTIAVIMLALNEKANELLQKIEQTAGKLKAAVA